jgi:hypothetical protein
MSQPIRGPDRPGIKRGPGGGLAHNNIGSGNGSLYSARRAAAQRGDSQPGDAKRAFPEPTQAPLRMQLIRCQPLALSWPPAGSHTGEP